MITVKSKIEISDIDIQLEHFQYELLKEVNEKMGKIIAMRVLRFAYPTCGLKQAKEFVEGL